MRGRNRPPRITSSSEVLAVVRSSVRGDTKQTRRPPARAPGRGRPRRAAVPATAPRAGKRRPPGKACNDDFPSSHRPEARGGWRRSREGRARIRKRLDRGRSPRKGQPRDRAGHCAAGRHRRPRSSRAVAKTACDPCRSCYPHLAPGGHPRDRCVSIQAPRVAAAQPNVAPGVVPGSVETGTCGKSGNTALVMLCGGPDAEARHGYIEGRFR